MIITCPSCTTRYRIPSLALSSAAGRPVRCTNCGHSWSVTASPVEQALTEKLRAQLAADAKTSSEGGPETATDGSTAAVTQEENQALLPAAPPPTAPEPPSAHAAVASLRDSREALVSEPHHTLHEEDPRDEAPLTATEDVLGDVAKDASPSTPPPAGDDIEGDTAAEGTEPDADVGSSAERSAAAKERKRRERRRRMALTALSSAVVVAISTGVLVLGRDRIMAAFPGATPWYAMAGLDRAPGAGLSLGDVVSAREDVAAGEAIRVEGAVTNTSEEARPLPMIRITLFDADDNELQHVTVAPDEGELAPGERLPFAARLENPAPNARRIKVTFASREAPQSAEAERSP